MNLGIALIALAVFTACNQQPAPQPVKPSSSLRVIELSFDANAQTSNANLRPQVVQPDSVLAFDSFNTATTPAALVASDSNFRYILRTFKFSNTTANALSNVTLYAYNQAANNKGGTAIKALTNFVGSADSTNAQSLLPTHGMSVSSGAPVIVSGLEDLQVFSTSEASAIQLAASPAIISANDSVLEYGFVARSLNGGRTIGASGCAGTDCNRGQVTVAYKIPLGQATSTYGFTATFVVSTEINARVTRSPDETDSAANFRANALSASQVVLGGVASTYSGTQIPQANAKISTTPALLLEPSCAGAATLTPIFTIQGTGTTGVAGTYTTEGVVVGDFQSTDSTGLQGFYLQDRFGDGNSATSDAILVDQSTTTPDTAVSVGDYVRVTGTVDETFTLTRIVPSSIIACGTRAVPVPTKITFPLPNGQADLEKYEAMLVQIPSQMTVTELFQLGQFGQATLSSASAGTDNQPGTDNRLDQYTQFNTPNVAGNTAHLAALKKRSIIIDDGRSDSNPSVNLLGRGGNPLTATNTLRGGDTITDLTGVMDYRFSFYRIQPTAPANFVSTTASARPTAPTIGGTLRVASFNVLNFFTTLNQASFAPVSTGCTNTITARGADTAQEFTRQKDKIVQAILAINPDVLGVIEMQNNGTTAMNDLVAALNTLAGSGTYAAASAPANGYGCDAIKVDFIYKPGTVILGTIASPNTTTYTSFSSSGTGRSPVAATFTQISNSQVFTAVMNHFKSKGSGGGDTGDGQGNANVLRTQNATDLKNWLATNPTGTTDPDYLIMGDINAYHKEDPLTTLETAGYTNLNPSSSYSYVFDGAWGSLDHALGSATLITQVAGAEKFHVSADEPTALDFNIELDDGTVIKTAAQIISLYAADAYRASDHDPVVVGLNLGGTATPGFTVSAGTLGSSSFTTGIAGSSSSTITLNRTSFPDPVTLTLEGAPSGVTGSFLPNNTSGNTSTLTLDLDNTVAAGTYPLTVKGTSGTTIASSSSFSITVSAPCSVSAVTVSSAGNATSVNVNSTLQLTATVTSSATNCNSVTWSSDSTNATVSSTGLVRGEVAGQAIITATSNVDNTKVGTINLTVNASVATTGLVINEVDYDQVGTDSTEYIEIYNPTASAISLSGIKVFLVNGNGNATYTVVDLSSGVSLAANSYLVIANAAFLGTITASVEITLPGTSDLVQNGAPDGIALVDTNTNTIVDAFSYEGSMTAAVLTGVGTFSLVEGTALAAATADSNTVVGALIRSPNGTDTNNAATDWAFTAILTPGAAN